MAPNARANGDGGMAGDGIGIDVIREVSSRRGSWESGRVATEYATSVSYAQLAQLTA